VVRSLGAGTDDAAIAAYAISSSRIVITQDQDDFRTLYAAHADHPGLIVIYPMAREPSVAQIVAAINNIAAIYQDLTGAVISLNEFFW
jgi:predicted nuclease of predicted toxin-antitoxin system